MANIFTPELDKTRAREYEAEKRFSRDDSCFVTAVVVGVVYPLSQSHSRRRTLHEIARRVGQIGDSRMTHSIAKCLRRTMTVKEPGNKYGKNTLKPQAAELALEREANSLKGHSASGRLQKLQRDKTAGWISPGELFALSNGMPPPSKLHQPSARSQPTSLIETLLCPNEANALLTTKLM